MEEKAVRVRIHGRVQGVSFRYYAYQQALRLGVKGWIRNKPDGSVAGFFQGTEEQVEGMVRWCSKGSPMAVVESIEEETVPLDETMNGFNVHV
ncbi:MAG: acylphosphatase [Anaerolineales bacterium]|nr:acylphosphatase [Anaerolineales bacterium]